MPSDTTSKTDTNGSGNGAANGAGVPPVPPAPPLTTAAQSAPTQAAAAAPVEPMRLRVKVWTDPATKKRYLMPMATLDAKKGTMTAYAMTDEDTKMVKLTPAEWNSLPFHYFKEDGPAPRASTRVPDLVAR